MAARFVFKGKDLITSEWCIGYLCKFEERCFILFGNPVNLPTVVEVISETVCQSIGKEDRRGRQLFEGDVVKTKYGRECIIEWFEPSMCFDLKPVDTPENIDLRAPDKWDLWRSENLEFVRNIHDIIL